MPDNPSDATPPGVWMTKAELAAVRGIDVASVDKLMRRHRWERMSPNAKVGPVRILVPPQWATGPRPSDDGESPQDAAEEGRDDDGGTGVDVRGIADRLDLAVAALEGLAEAQARARAAEAEVASLRQEAASLRLAGDLATSRIAELEAQVRAGEEAAALRRLSALWGRLCLAVGRP